MHLQHRDLKHRVPGLWVWAPTRRHNLGDLSCVHSLKTAETHIMVLCCLPPSMVVVPCRLWLASGSLHRSVGAV